MPMIDGREVVINDYLRKLNGISGYITAIDGDQLTFTDLIGTAETLTVDQLTRDDFLVVDVPALAVQLTQLSAAVDQLIMDSLLGGM